MLINEKVYYNKDKKSRYKLEIAKSDMAVFYNMNNGVASILIFNIGKAESGSEPHAVIPIEVRGYKDDNNVFTPTSTTVIDPKYGTIRTYDFNIWNKNYINGVYIIKP